MHKIAAKILNRAGLIPHLNFTTHIEVNGQRLKIPVVQRLGFTNMYMSETWMIELMKRVFPLKKGFFLDVGANLGQTLLKVKGVDMQREYVGFEPNPSCVFYLNQLIQANQFTDCSLVPIGISDETQVLMLNFYHADETDSTASIIEEFRPDQKIVRQSYVPVFDYDQLRALIGSHRAPAFVKVDVEGAEWEVLKSLEPLLAAHRPMIFCEILPVYKKENTTRLSRQQKIEDLLHRNQYQIVRVNKSQNGTGTPSLELKQTFGIHGDIHQCDYMFIPQEDISELAKNITVN